MKVSDYSARYTISTHRPHMVSSDKPKRVA